MRYWIYAEPATANTAIPVFTILSDEAVLAQYWEYWSNNMRRVGKDYLICKETCILDWATIHWAWEATPEAVLRIIQNEDARTP